jgi:small subunit ribosomal protein S20
MQVSRIIKRDWTNGVDYAIIMANNGLFPNEMGFNKEWRWFELPTRSSGMKHVRADQKKRDRNMRRKSALRTMLKQTESAIADGEMEQAQELYRQAASQLDKAAGKGVIKKGMANRKKSRLAHDLNKIAAA